MQTRPASHAVVLAVATLTADTHIQNKPEMDDQTEKQRHESESRKVPCAPTSLVGNEDEENGALMQMSQLSPQTNEQEKESLPNAGGTDENVLDEQDNMET
jgi:hypothetical protein